MPRIFGQKGGGKESPQCWRSLKFSALRACSLTIKNMEETKLIKLRPFVICSDSTVKAAEAMVEKIHPDEETDRQRMIKDFAYAIETGVISEAEVSGDAYEKKQQTPKPPLVKPFSIASDQTVQIASQLVDRIQPALPETADISRWEQFFVKAIQNNSIPDDKIQFSQVIETNGIVNSVLNFDLCLLKRVVKIIDTERGEKPTLYYEVQVRVRTMDGNQLFFQEMVEGHKIKDFAWLKKATASTATVPNDKNEKEEFHLKVQRCIESKNVPTETIYQRAGWRNVPGKGHRFVYADGIIGETGGLTHTVSGEATLDINQNQLGTALTFRRAMEMSDICKNRAASSLLLLYVHSAMISTLLKKAGHPLNFVFGIMGVTNSRKTSLALAIAKVFDRDNLKANAEFATATECGIEKTLGIYKDGPVIVDDFKPGVTQMQQNNMDKKLDLLVRFCGDGVEKKRMLDFTTDSDSKFFPIEGGCVLTMEVLTGVMSSISRMFITEISKDDIINERLSFYQQNRWILPTHLYNFLWWVADNFDQIIDYIQHSIMVMRTQYTFAVARYAEMYAMLLTTANLLTWYAFDRKFWDDATCSAYIESVKEVLLGELHIMEERLRYRDKAQTVLEAFADVILHAYIIPVWLTAETCSECHGFYENEQFYFIQTKELQRIVSEYCARYKIQCALVNNDELVQLLERKGLLDVYEVKGRRERARKLPIQHGNCLRYLYINKARMEECQEKA